ncbi:MAG: protein phosphatase 2C domain-containing protein [Planctomycetota bacterium]
MSIQIDCHGDSHVGNYRPANEDQFLIADLNKSMRVYQTSLGLSHQTRLFGGSQGKLLLVADGLGGHESGERASTLAVDGVANYILNTMDWMFRLNEQNENDFRKHLVESFVHSQNMIDAESKAIPQRRGMATTLTMAYVDWPNVYVVHVGDTRCYLIRDGSIKCLTIDHTVGQLARNAASENEGGFKVDAANQDTSQANPMNHALWNVVGGPDDSLEPQVSRVKLTTGDILLLCSDGLTRYLPDQEILGLATQEIRTAKQICEELIVLANDRGGRDNITTVLAKFETGGTEPNCVQEEASLPRSIDDTVEHFKMS